MNNSYREDIDFVILWVDGQDPKHTKKRNKFLQDFDPKSVPDPERANSDLRFHQNNELKYCLRAIKKYAPWYRKIWIITDDQFPHFLNPNLISEDKIEIIDHKIIYRNYEHLLPVFNSRSIATLMWRIPGISSKFIFANDDMFIARPINSSYFFKNNSECIHGTFEDWQSSNQASLHRLGIQEGAKLVEFSKKNTDKLFIYSHTFTSYDTNKLKSIFEKYKDKFEYNIKFRFRSKEQFLIESAYQHYLLKTQKNFIVCNPNIVLMNVNFCRNASFERVDFLLNLINKNKRDALCINDYASLKKTYPNLEEFFLKKYPTPLISEILN